MKKGIKHRILCHYMAPYHILQQQTKIIHHTISHQDQDQDQDHPSLYLTGLDVLVLYGASNVEITGYCSLKRLP